MAIVAEKTNGIVMITDPEKRVIWINNSFDSRFRKIIVPGSLRKNETAEDAGEEMKPESVDIKKRRSLNSFWDKFKDSIIDLFKEEGDTEIK